MATKPSNPGQMSHFFPNPRVARLLQPPVGPDGGDDESEDTYAPGQGTRAKERLPGYSRKAMRLAMKEKQD
jgi:hypothetical protein